MNIQSKILEIIKEEASNNEISLPTDIKIEHSLVEDLGFDSIMLLQFVLRLEDEFNVDIDDDYLEPELFESLANIVKFLEEYNKSQLMR